VNRRTAAALGISLLVELLLKADRVLDQVPWAPDPASAIRTRKHVLSERGLTG
jgi:hypothetical protein